MRSAFTAALLVLMTGVPAYAERFEAAPTTQPAAEGPAGADLFAKHVTAIGGEAAMRAVKNRSTEGMLHNKTTNFYGRLNTVGAAPNKSKTMVESTGTDSWLVCYDGEAGWSIQLSQGTTRLLQGAELDNLRRQSYFYSEVDYAKRFKTIGRGEKAEVDGKPAWRVAVVGNEGERLNYYFAAEGEGLAVAIETPPPAERPKDPSTILYVFDYKKFGDVLFPTRMVQKQGNNEVVTTIDRITVNTVDEREFARPPEVVKGLEDAKKKAATPPPAGTTPAGKPK